MNPESTMDAPGCSLTHFLTLIACSVTTFTALSSDDAAIQVRSRTMLGSQEYTVTNTAWYNFVPRRIRDRLFIYVVERVLLHTAVNLL